MRKGWRPAETSHLGIDRAASSISWIHRIDHWDPYWYPVLLLSGLFIQLQAGLRLLWDGISGIISSEGPDTFWWRFTDYTGRSDLMATRITCRLRLRDVTAGIVSAYIPDQLGLCRGFPHQEGLSMESTKLMIDPLDFGSAEDLGLDRHSSVCGDVLPGAIHFVIHSWVSPVLRLCIHSLLLTCCQ